jgi:hypothetical protein
MLGSAYSRRLLRIRKGWSALHFGWPWQQIEAGGKFGAHFGAHLDRKQSFFITIHKRVKTSRKEHEYSLISFCRKPS